MLSFSFLSEKAVTSPPATTAPANVPVEADNGLLVPLTNPDDVTYPQLFVH